MKKIIIRGDRRTGEKDRRKGDRRKLKGLIGKERRGRYEY